MKRILLFTALVCCCTALLSPVWGAEGASPRVVVSIKPLHALVSGVMSGVAEPELLIKGGGSPHGYVLRPSEAQALAHAELIIWGGPQLESFLTKPLGTLGSKARQLELLAALKNDLLQVRTGGSWDAHLEEDGHDHAVHDHADHELNPHLWLSPRLAELIVAQTAAALTELDPAHQDVYRQNADRMKHKLEQLDRELRHKLAPVAKVPYVVFHDAYQYFEAAYGLNAVGSITIDPERKPGVKRLREIREKIKQLRARAVFSEPQFEPKLVATIIEGTGAGTGQLDPLGAELEPGEDSYFKLLNGLADDLLAGLQ